MRKITALFLLTNCLFLFGIHFSHAQTVPSGQTVYVTDQFEITMRTGPTVQNKIIAMLATGTALHIIREEGDWLLVQSPTGIEGWILKRYVSPETPKSLVIEGLQKKYEAVLKTSKSATDKAGTLERENRELKVTLSQSQDELKKVKQTYDKLAAGSKDYLNLKEKFDTNLNKFNNATAELEQLRKENSELRSNENIRWFMIGAAVVALSWLIGYLMGKIRKRERGSSLYR